MAAEAGLRSVETVGIVGEPGSVEEGVTDSGVGLGIDAVVGSGVGLGIDAVVGSRVGLRSVEIEEMSTGLESVDKAMTCSGVWMVSWPVLVKACSASLRSFKRSESSAEVSGVEAVSGTGVSEVSDSEVVAGSDGDAEEGSLKLGVESS